MLSFLPPQTKSADYSTRYFRLVTLPCYIMSIHVAYDNICATENGSIHAIVHRVIASIMGSKKLHKLNASIRVISTVFVMKSNASVGDRIISSVPPRRHAGSCFSCDTATCICKMSRNFMLRSYNLQKSFMCCISSVESLRYEHGDKASYWIPDRWAQSCGLSCALSYTIMKPDRIMNSMYFTDYVAGLHHSPSVALNSMFLPSKVSGTSLSVICVHVERRVLPRAHRGDQSRLVFGRCFDLVRDMVWIGQDPTYLRLARINLDSGRKSRYFSSACKVTGSNQLGKM